MILITGATGHLGNTLVHQLAKQGLPLRLFLQESESIRSLDGLSFELICGDIRDAQAVLQACEGVDYVYHLAALIDLGLNESALLESINVCGTRNVVQACLQQQVKRLVYVSSIHAIPEPPMGTPIREVGAKAFPNPNLLGNYARSKSLACAEVFSGIDKGLDAVLIFPSGIIGPRDFRGSEMGRVLKRLIQKGHRQHLACFDGAYNFVDVRDVATALVSAMRQGRSGEGYLIAGQSISLAQLYRIVLSAIGQPSIRLIRFPLSLVRFAAKCLGSLGRLFRRPTLLNPYSVAVLCSNCEVDCSKAKRDLDFHPRPVERSLRETVAWIKWREAKLHRDFVRINFQTQKEQAKLKRQKVKKEKQRLKHERRSAHLRRQESN